MTPEEQFTNCSSEENIVRNLILVLGDQLDHNSLALDDFDAEQDAAGWPRSKRKRRVSTIRTQAMKLKKALGSDERI